MKKLKYTLIALLVLCMTGCNESSFLEEDPRASLYPENLLVDYSGFQSMVTSLYGIPPCRCTRWWSAARSALCMGLRCGQFME